MKKEKKHVYRIVSESHGDWGICYIAEKYKPLFRGMGYRKKLDDDGIEGRYSKFKYGIEGRYSKFKYKEDAEMLIERYKNNDIEGKGFGVEGYY